MTPIRSIASPAIFLAVCCLVSSCACNNGNGSDAGTGGGTNSGLTGGGSTASGGGSGSIGGGSSNTGGGSETGGGTGNTGGGTFNTGGGTGITGFATQAVTELCARAIACNGIPSASLSACETYYNAYLESFTKTAAHASEFTYSAANAASCIDSIKTAPCSAVSGVYVGTNAAACSTVLTGLVGSGAACHSTQSCSTGLGCSGAACNGSCGPLGALNQECRSGGGMPQCDSGLWCDNSFSNGVCRASGGAGASCQPFATNTCQANFTCPSTTRMCTRLPTAGQPCLSFECDSTSYCSGTQCEARSGLNMTCSFSQQCNNGLVCRNSQCQTGIALGQPCTQSNDCASNRECDEVLHTCQNSEYVSLGSVCTDSAIRCSTGVCKNVTVNADGGVGSAGTCMAAQLGDPCTNSYTCPASAYCTGSFGTPGVCTAAGAGTPCDSTNNCRPTDYCSRGGQNQVCAARIASGQTCNIELRDVCANPVETCLALPSAPTDTRCRTLGTQGTPCINSNGCAFGFGCVSQVCQPAGLLNTDCLGGQVCAAGACDEVPDAGGSLVKCGPPRAVGQPCNFNASCVSNFCDPVSRTCSAVCQ